MAETTSPKRRTHSHSLLPWVLVLAFTELSPMGVGATAPATLAPPIQAPSQAAKPAAPLPTSKITVVRLIDGHIRQAQKKMNFWTHRLSVERRRISKFGAVLAGTPPVSGRSAARAATALRAALAHHQQAWRQRIRVRQYMARFAKVRALVLAALHGRAVRGLKPGPITYRRWAWAFLRSFGAPTCGSNMTLVVSWETAESTVSRFNPLATTYWLPGAMTYGKSRIQNYASFAQGVQASRDTLLASPDSYNYAPVVDDLLTCAPSARTAMDIRDSEWCHGCTKGAYLVGTLSVVRGDLASHESRRVGGG